MGFWAEIFLGPECKYCGKRSLKEVAHFGRITMCYCKSCNIVGTYDHIPRCYVCGTRQTIVGYNSYNVPVPKCPKCGYLYDGEEK